MIQLNNTSLHRLSEVHPDIASVFYRAADISDLDFIVTEGLRTVERQRKLVASGASQTMNSRHLTGHAVDVAIRLDGEVRWDWPLYVRFANTMREAALDTGIPIVWGGAWCLLNEAGDMEDEVANYVSLRRSMGRRPFLDGPHYELFKEVYS